jgi:hypothetical protein
VNRYDFQNEWFNVQEEQTGYFGLGQADCRKSKTIQRRLIVVPITTFHYTETSKERRPTKHTKEKARGGGQKDVEFPKIVMGTGKENCRSVGTLPRACRYCTSWRVHMVQDLQTRIPEWTIKVIFQGRTRRQQTVCVAVIYLKVVSRTRYSMKYFLIIGKRKDDVVPCLANSPEGSSSTVALLLLEVTARSVIVVLNEACRNFLGCVPYFVGLLQRDTVDAQNLSMHHHGALTMMGSFPTTLHSDHLVN